MLDTIRRSFKPAFFFLGTLIKSSWYLILPAHILCFCLIEYFRGMAQAHSHNSTVSILMVLAAVLMTLIRSLVFLLIVPGRFDDFRQKRKYRSFFFLLKKYTLPLTLEGLRVVGKTILWLLLFIFPGLFQAWRLYLVPLIVVLNPQYDEGKVDALRHSHKLIRGRDFVWVPFLVFLAVFDLSYEIFSVAFTVTEPLSQVLVSVFTLPLSLYSFSLLVHVYEGLEQKHEAKGE